MLTLPREVRSPLEQFGDQIRTAIERWLPGRRDHDADGGKNGAARLARRAFGGPALDVEETDDAVIVRAELLGL